MDNRKMVDPPIPSYIDYNGIPTCTRCFRNVLHKESLCLKCNIVGYFDCVNKPSDPPQPSSTTY